MSGSSHQRAWQPIEANSWQPPDRTKCVRALDPLQRTTCCDFNWGVYNLPSDLWNPRFMGEDGLGQHCQITAGRPIHVGRSNPEQRGGG